MKSLVNQSKYDSNIIEFSIENLITIVENGEGSGVVEDEKRERGGMMDVGQKNAVIDIMISCAQLIN